LSLDDLGGDVKSMEEVDLRGIKSCRSSRTAEINGRDDSYSCLCWYFVGLDFSSELMDGGISENECDLILKEGYKGRKFGYLTSELFFKMLELLVVNALNSHADDLLDECLCEEGFTFLEMTS